MNELLRRVERLEQRVEALRVPEPVPVIIGELGESEDVIREHHNVGPRERVVVVAVTDASRGG